MVKTINRKLRNGDSGFELTLSKCSKDYKMDYSSSLEQALQEGNILRQLNVLIVTHLRHHNFSQGLVAENNGTLRVLLPTSYGSIATPQRASIDFSVTHLKGSSKTLPKHESKATIRAQERR